MKTPTMRFEDIVARQKTLMFLLHPLETYSQAILNSDL
jgi:hypothetical protein